MTSEPAENGITVSHAESGVSTVLIDSPPVNALRFVDIEALNEAFKELGARKETRCVLLEATGQRAFIAGTDVREFTGLTAQNSTRLTDLVQELVERIYELRVPVVAAINGPALGSGVAIASAADIRIASTKGKLGLPEIDVGVMGGSKHIARLLPQGMSRLMMYTGVRLDAQECYRLGAFEKVVEPEELHDAALDVAESIASKFPRAIELAKQGLNRTEFMSLTEGYEYECLLTAILRSDPESAEVSKSFFKGPEK